MHQMPIGTIDSSWKQELMVIFHTFKAFQRDTLPLAPILCRLCRDTQVLLNQSPLPAKTDFHFPF